MVKRSFSAVLLLSILLPGVSAGNDSLRSTPKSETRSLVYCTPATTIGPRKLQLSATGAYGADEALVIGTNGSPTIRNVNDGRPVAPGTSRIVNGNVDCRVGVHRMVDVSLALPLYMDFTGWGEGGTYVGDLSITGILNPFAAKLPLQAGLRVEVMLPTGTFEQSYLPRHVYNQYENPRDPGVRNVTYLENRVYVHPTLLLSLDVQRLIDRLPLSVHGNAGFVTAGMKEAFTIDAAIGIAMRPVTILQIGVELSSEFRPMLQGRSLTDAVLSDPLRCAPSVCVDLPAGFSVLLAGELGLSNGHGDRRMNWIQNDYVYSTKATTQLGAALSVIYRGGPFGGGKRGKSERRERREERRWNNDRDRDSIPDSLDRCPETPEDYDEFEDRDGCPDYDNDADQVPDSIDACPNEAGIERNRGCPENGAIPFVRTVLSGVTFASGKSKIVSGKKSLDRIAKFLKATPKATVEIQVHTDNRGAAAANTTLSKQRAEVVKLYLVAQGIRSDRITAIGMGSEFPVADNSTKAGRAKNQRVEIRRVQ